MANIRNIIDTKWSHNLAYAVGLITTDGNLSPDHRHLNLTSKDKQQIETFRRILKLKNKIGKKRRGGGKEKKYFVIQFGSKNFYEFLLRIGLTPNKSKTLGQLEIPRVYFSDFLRGCIDGDGSISISSHPESTLPQLRLRLCSASKKFLSWIHSRIKIETEITGGWICHQQEREVLVLSFGKFDSVKILKYMYYNNHLPCLKRKYILARQFISAGGEIG